MNHAVTVPQKPAVSYARSAGYPPNLSAVPSDAEDPMLLIRTLEAQWNAERALEADAASVMVASVILGFTSSRYWFLLAGVVGLFLLEHAIVGRRPSAAPRRSGGNRLKGGGPKAVPSGEEASPECAAVAALPPQ